MKYNILVIDDDQLIRSSLKLALEGEGYFVKPVSNGAEGIALVRQNIIPFHAVIVDYHMPKENGAEVLAQIREINEKLPVMVFSGDNSNEVYDDVVSSGAITVLTKGRDEDRIVVTIRRLIQEYDRQTKILKPRSESKNHVIISSVDMVGASDHLAEIASHILKFGPLEQTVLIRGENGTGKEKVAAAIHDNSKRKNKPFIAINCAAIAKDLVESELFGSEKGAFTGAIQRKGKFQAAQDGTIFLDEIGDMTPSAQAALLRALQEKEVTPIGANHPVKVNVRVIAATNADLELKIKDGSFRQDLFYRLNALQIDILPLRERPDDIPPLILHYLESLNKENGTQKTILESTIRSLQRRAWSGNVRELFGTLATMYALSSDSVLEEKMPTSREVQAGTQNEEEIIDYDVVVYENEEREREVIKKAVTRSTSLTGAARLLNMARNTLRSRMKVLGIENPFSEKEEK